MNRIEQVKFLLMEEIKEKMQILPFGFGQEENTEGYPNWTVYIDSEGILHGTPYIYDKFNANKTVYENIESLPLYKICLLAQLGLSDDELFKEIYRDYRFKNGMCNKALEDAKIWKNKT